MEFCGILTAWIVDGFIFISIDIVTILNFEPYTGK